MFYLCKGNGRKRITLSCSRFYSHEELFRLVRTSNKSIPIWFEYGPNLYQHINNDCELRFACQMVQGDIESNLPIEDYEQHKLDLLDYAHTTECENFFRTRKSRAARTKLLPCKKRYSDIQNDAITHKHRHTEHDGETMVDSDT
ncbi:hypothetical protein T484DRAFT_1749755 [Baffinella frigidus]|nr:hypothetical protein T484DRAFT_1749755 [Cryptophyta sp. CCMP2293]